MMEPPVISVTSIRAEYYTIVTGASFFECLLISPSVVISKKPHIIVRIIYSIVSQTNRSAFFARRACFN